MSKEPKISKLEQYKKTYNYQQLIKNHALSEQGIWKVRGEDPNCDFGGHHYQPELGTFEGKLEDIIVYAVNLPSFWQWGAGGDITRIGMPIKIDASSSVKRVAAEQKIAKLELDLKKARQELNSLDNIN